MTLRPYGVVLDGRLELGLELVLADGKVQAIRPHTGVPEPYVVSPAFVNAHSHLEYRGLQGKVNASGYWAWIREITQIKPTQSLADVRGDTMLAAQENRLTGVALIGEHSDRPFAAEAMAMAGLDGRIFQELLTLFEHDDPDKKLAAVSDKATEQAKVFRGPVAVSPHAPYTVDPATLGRFASGGPFSIHVAESPIENEFYLNGTGPIAEMVRSSGAEAVPRGVSSVDFLESIGLLRSGAQFVHCCDVSSADIERMAARGVTVAHCPRSNHVLECPAAPIREMLDAGISVGLGLDSAASSGPIDMFSEMRSALDTAQERGASLRPEEVWDMATTMGAQSLWRDGWAISEGSSTPLIKVHVPDALTIEELIQAGTPDKIEWVATVAESE